MWLLWNCHTFSASLLFIITSIFGWDKPEKSAQKAHLHKHKSCKEVEEKEEQMKNCWKSHSMAPLHLEVIWQTVTFSFFFISLPFATWHSQKKKRYKTLTKRRFPSPIPPSHSQRWQPSFNRAKGLPARSPWNANDWLIRYSMPRSLSPWPHSPQSGKWAKSLTHNSLGQRRRGGELGFLRIKHSSLYPQRVYPSSYLICLSPSIIYYENTI